MNALRTTCNDTNPYTNGIISYASSLAREHEKLKTSLSCEEQRRLESSITKLKTEYATAIVVLPNTTISPLYVKEQSPASYEQFKFTALSVEFDCTAPTARMEYIKTLQELLTYYNILQMLYDNTHFSQYKCQYKNHKYKNCTMMNRMYTDYPGHYLRILTQQMTLCYVNYSISTLRSDLIKALRVPLYSGPYLYNYTLLTPQYIDYIKQYKCECANKPHHNAECCIDVLEYFNILDTTIAELIAQHAGSAAPSANAAILTQIAKLKTEFATYVAKMHEDIDSLASAIALA
jgi:hypothetical protein